MITKKMENKTIEEIVLIMARQYADTIEGHPCAHRSRLIKGFQDGYLKAAENYPEPKQTITTKKPYLCPVCSGNGLVPAGFYSHTSGQWSTTNTSPEQCKSCSGSGVIIT